VRRLNLRSLIPNLITLSGLSFGLSSIRFAIEGEFSLAVICILFAAVCDVLDGMLARHLESESDSWFSARFSFRFSKLRSSSWHFNIYGYFL